MTLAPADAAELAEMLQFLSDWLARDHDHLEASLEGFAGNCAYGTRQLHDDLTRFIFCWAEHAPGLRRRRRFSGQMKHPSGAPFVLASGSEASMGL